MSSKELQLYLNFGHFFDHLFLLIFPTAAIAIADDWDISYAEALALGTPLYAALALGTLPAGWLGDRYDRSILIAIFFLGGGASSLFIAFSSNATSLMIGLSFLGFFAAFYHPIGLALLTTIAQRTGRALAINGIYGNMGLAAAAAATGFLSQYSGWRSAFILPGVIALIIGTVMFYRCLKSTAPKEIHIAKTDEISTLPARRVQISVFIIVCVSALFGGLVFNAITVSLPKFFEERLITLEGDLAWIGASTGIIFALASFAQLPVGEILDRFGARPIFIFLLSLQSILLVLLSFAEGWSVLALSLGLLTMIFAEIPLTSWLLGHYIPKEIRSRAMSMEYMLALGVGSAAIPIIAGMHHIGWGFDIQFISFAICIAIVFCAIWFLPRKVTSGAKPAML